MKPTFTRALLAIAIICLTGNVFAQSTLTAANSNPQAGETFKDYDPKDTVYISPGDSGANVVWDFHLFGADAVPSTETYVACNSTPYCDNFPGGNLAIADYSVNINGADTTRDSSYGYYNANINSFSTLGNIFKGSVSDTEMYTNVINLQYPVTYHSSFTNSYSKFQQLSSADFGPTDTSSAYSDYYYYGTQTATCDGYGTLITPAGTFENALRLHIVRHETDSDVANGTFTVAVYHMVVNEYRWYMPGYHNILFAVGSSYDSTTPQAPKTTYSYFEEYTAQATTAVPTVNKINTTFELYPNPAIETLNIKFSVPGRQVVSVTILDMLGKEVGTINGNTYEQGVHRLTYNTSRLPKSMYVVRLQNGVESMMKKIEVM